MDKSLSSVCFVSSNRPARSDKDNQDSGIRSRTSNHILWLRVLHEHRQGNSNGNEAEARVLLQLSLDRTLLTIFGPLGLHTAAPPLWPLAGFPTAHTPPSKRLVPRLPIDP